MLNAFPIDLDQVDLSGHVDEYDQLNSAFHRLQTHLSNSDMLIAEVGRSQRSIKLVLTS